MDTPLEQNIRRLQIYFFIFDLVLFSFKVFFSLLPEDC
jgi:hypothetical protein